MYEITNKIADYFAKQELKFNKQEAGELSYIELGFGLKTGSVKIRVLCPSEESVKIQSEDFANFKKEKLADAYECANELNNRFKYVKFRIDPEDGAVSCDHDIPTCILSAGEGPAAAYEIVMRMANIIETAYPDVMKKIWG